VLRFFSARIEAKAAPIRLFCSPEPIMSAPTFVSSPLIAHALAVLLMTAGSSVAVAQSSLPADTLRVNCQRNLPSPAGACLGEISYSNGNRYVGPIVAQRPVGKGELSYSDGRRYTGDFADGQPTGQGSMNFPDGAVYVGEFKDDLYSGEGMLLASNATRYQGQFSRSLFNGRGSLQLPNGDRYEGEFRAGLQTGQGRVRSPAICMKYPGRSGGFGVDPRTGFRFEYLTLVV
jgi:hypothetical protein